MKKNIIKRIICFAVLVTLLAFIPSSAVNAKPKYEFEVKLNAGYGQKVMVGYGAPFSITVTNKNSSNFEGYIQLIIPGYANNNVLYEEEIALGAGETKTVNIIAGVLVPSDKVNVRLTNKKFKVLWEELQNITVAKNKSDIKVGVLTDDFSALGYMDRVHFLSDFNMYTSLVELSASDFPVEYAALDMLDIILISDFSTDLLTKEQINALNLWTRKGGILIIGTGSTANKTLSGLKGNIINENVTSTTAYNTTLGLAIEDYSYVSTLNTSSNSYAAYDGFYDSYYYYDFDCYNDSSYYYDSDFDGQNDYIFNYGGQEVNGDYYDAYQNLVDPSYLYLYDDSAFYQSSDGSYHYRYYDDRYGYPSDTLEDILDQLGYDEEYFEYVCYTEYCNLYGFDPKWLLTEQLGLTDEYDLDNEFEYYFGDDFREFMHHYAYLYMNYEFYGVDFRPDLSQNLYGFLSNDLKYMNIDCAGLDDTLARNTDEIIVGDTSDGDEFTLAKSLEYGDGRVILCAVDFTKNPIPKNAASGEFFRNLIEKTAGQKLIREADDYESSVSSSYFYNSGPGYSEENLIKAAGSAPVPPLIFYVGVILLYFVAILVVYLVALKKKKTWNLWIIYPASALAVSVLIFCLGFSSRVLRLNTNVITLLFPDSVSTKEVDYVNITVPKAKEYVIDFTNEIELDRNFCIDNGAFLGTQDVDYDTYAVRYRGDYNHYQSVISNKVALENQAFLAEAAYPTQGGIDVSLVTDLSIGGKEAKNIQVTNNYSTVLEDVIVQLYTNNGYEDYYFKSVKPGESVVASAGKFIDDSGKTSSYYSSYSSYSKKYNNRLTAHYESHKSGDIVAGIFLGNLYRGFARTIQRNSVLTYVQNEYSPDMDHVLVVAFPKSDIAAKVVEGKKSKLNRTEAIIITEDYQNLQNKYNN